MAQATATAAVAGTESERELREMGALCDTLRADRERDRKEMARLNRRLNQLVRVVRFGLGALLEGFEDPASEEVLDLAELAVA